MDYKGILSSAFNMSMGFIPVIISILLCEFITQDTAIYIGTVIGIVGVYLSYHRKRHTATQLYSLYIGRNTDSSFWQPLFRAIMFLKVHFLSHWK